MSCPHRFINDLMPDWSIDYLFVGTFNPSWDRPNKPNANWFYGRPTNDFWYIMPQVFGLDSLMHRQYRNDPDFLRDWCIKNKIGITDIIKCINDADVNNPNHRSFIESVLDRDLEEFNNFEMTGISEIIESNLDTLKGVYLTRFENGLNNGSVLMNGWNSVIEMCNRHEKNCSGLVTPSRGYRGITRDQKLAAWRNTILMAQ